MLQQTIWKLENTIKDYDWGSRDDITLLFGIQNPSQKPMAEVWMGTHPLGCSVAIDVNNQKIKLDELIKNNPLETLGEKTFKHFHELPYLFKILAANKALSIQVHPTKVKAKQGFEKENKLGIALNSPDRNYKDPNHKPELIYALTPFKAMNSFRPIDEILTLFAKVKTPSIADQINMLKHNPLPEQLKIFFQGLLTLSPEHKSQAINELLASIKSFDQEPYLTVKSLAIDYPNDIGLFMPLILNIIEIQPMQAMFLYAETPHAYLKGTGLEIMANSDNVLRAGLTHKYIDIQELIKNTNFNSVPLNQLLTSPKIEHNKIAFPVPVDDFKFEIIQSDNHQREEKVTSPQILLCLTGNITLETNSESLTITKGESVFIAYKAQYYRYQGDGILAKAYN